MKRILWMGNSREVVRRFSHDVRQETGYQLLRLQLGHMPNDWKSMPSIGLGVNEIRIQADRSYRVIYVAKFVEAIYVLHAFVKKTRGTSQKDLDIASSRYRALLAQRRPG